MPGGAVCGIDSSTQSTKVEIRRLDDGAVLARASARHPEVHPPISEQHPDAWWSALVEAMATVDPAVRATVESVAVGGQQHGLVLLDDAMRPLRPAILWNDTRNAEAAAALVDSMGETAWLHAVGTVPVPAITVAKLAWVAAAEPELRDRVAHVHLPHDEITRRLCGEFVTDRGDASGTGWFDPVADEVRPELLGLAVGGDGDEWLDRLAEVVPHDRPAGRLTATAAEQLGLPPGIAVAAGTGDNMAAAVGLGLGPGDTAVSLGTSGTVYTVSPAPARAPIPEIAGFAAATGGFLPLVCTLNATRVTDTVARWFGLDHTTFAELALAAPAGVGPVVLPFFDGERTPNRPGATGALTGLTNDTSRESIARAAHDGVLCGLLEGLDRVTEAGYDTSGGIRLVGGGARSAAYRQRLADLAGAEIVVPTVDEAVATGAAVLAALALGHDRATVVDAWALHAGETVSPEATDGPEVREAHRALLTTTTT